MNTKFLKCPHGTTGNLKKTKEKKIIGKKGVSISCRRPVEEKRERANYQGEQGESCEMLGNCPLLGFSLQEAHVADGQQGWEGERKHLGQCGS